MTAVIQRTFREHHNSSKYLHWCTGLACGNLLFPPIRYFAILHGGWLWKQPCFHIFHTTKWHPSDKPGMRERKKYLCLKSWPQVEIDSKWHCFYCYIGVMMQQCNDNHFYSPLIHEPFLCQKVLDIRSTISSQNWPELSAFGMAASCLSLLPGGAAELAGAAAALLCWPEELSLQERCWAELGAGLLCFYHTALTFPRTTIAESAWSFRNWNILAF